MKKFIVFICILLTSTLTGYIFAEELDQYNIVYPPYNCPTSSISCNLAGRGITKIADNAFQNHIILTNLNLASNELTGIVASAFNGLSGLLELNLSDNKFKKWGGLSAIDLSNLTSLEKLIIRGNWWNRTFLTGDIQQDQFWGLSGLKYLDIGDNRFSGIKAGAFNNLENLNYLNINGSFDDFTLPANIFSGLSNLTGLDIKDNGLAKINIGAFNGLNNLETLNLGYSRLGGNTLLRQGSFVGLNALKYLDLSNSNLNYNLDTNLFLGLDNLVSLDINSSNVMSISAYAFSGLNQLTSLNLTNNQISSIEANAFYGLSSLPSLSLAHNQISNLAANAFHGVENITSLNLSDNKITNINADAFNGLNNLTSLDLGNNQIPDFKTTILNGLYMLNSLNLAYNQISSISSNLFNGNINLEYLHLDKNNITTINKDAFSGLTIKYLGLTSNQISYIESGALENLGLSSLYLQSNQLSSLLNGVLATRIPDSIYVSNNQISYIDNEALPKAYMGPHVIDLKNNKIESFNWNIFSGDFNINSIYLSENPISNVISATIGGHPQLSLIEVNKTCTYNAVTLNYNSYSSVTDGNYCAIVTSATINNFVSTLIGKGYSGDSSLLIGTGTISFKEGITNKFLVKTIMQSTNQNSYSGNYYNNKVEVEYPSNTSITYSGSAYSGLIHSPYLFNNKYVDGLTGIIALTRFGSLNGRVDFNKDIKIRIPADGKNIGDRAYIYSSNSIDVFSPGAAKWTYEKTTNITNINGIPYVEFTGNHASRRVISDNEEGVPLVGEISYSITTPTYGPVVATITLNKEGSITNNGGSTSYTFTNNGSFTFTFADGSGNTGSATATVNNIDNTPPVGTISYSTTNPISGNVIATLTLNETGIVTNNGGSTSYTFTNNGSFTFTFVDLAGNTGSVTATVNNITTPDTTPPTATVSYSTTAPTNGSVIATITLSEVGSITNNGGSTSYTFTNNGSFTFTFVDLAGNTGSTTATVNNITAPDTTPPTATVSYSTTAPTNGSVTATITLSEAGSITNNGGSNSYTFTNNGSFTFTFVDLAGNTGSVTATVNNITAPDTTPPTATVSYSTTAPTNGSVIATITLSEAGSITNNGGSNSYTFADNGSFTFTFVDLAGNTGSVTATVNNITIIPIPTCYSISPGSGSEVTTNPLIFYRKCYDGSGITNTKIQIYNILGNLLYSQDIDTNYNSFSFTGDAGTYYRNIEATNISGNKSNMAKQAVIYNPPFTIEMINTGILYNNIYYINTGVVDINLYSNGSFYSLFSGEFVGNDSLTYNTKYRGKTLTFSGEGARIVTVKYFSAQQNGSLGPVTYYIDTTKPIISGLSPTSGSITTDSSIVLSWSGTDKNSGISSYDIQITSSSGIIVYYDTTTNTSISVSNLDLGTYHWGVVAKDMAGNTAYSSINQFTIRDTPATTPNNFAFTSIRDAFIEKKYLSNTFTVSGLGENTQSPISISNGSGTIIKNNTNIGVSGYVVNGDIIQLQLTASDEYNTTISSTLNIGDISATFSITTREDESNDCSLSNTEKYKIANMFELLKDSYKGTSNKWINMLYILQSMTEDIQDFDYNCSLGYLTNLVENEIEDGGDNSDNGDTEIDESAHTAPNCKEYSVEYNEDMNAYTSSDIKKTIYFASRDTLTKFIDSQNPGDCHINIYTDEQFEFEDTDEYHVAPNGKIYTIEEKDGYYLSPTMSNSRQFDTLESLTEYIDKYNPPFEIRDHEVDTDVDPIEYTAPNDKEYKIYKTDQGYMSYKFLKVKYFDSLEEIEAFIDKNNPKQ